MLQSVACACALTSLRVHIWSCPVAHLVPVELFTRQLRSVMRPLSTICSLPGQEWRQREGRDGMGWDGMGEERERKQAKDGGWRERKE